MATYLGFDSSTQSLTATVIEIAGNERRVLFEHVLHFDAEFPEYGTTHGVIVSSDGKTVTAPPGMWAAALDRMAGILAAERRGPLRHPRHHGLGPAARQRLSRRRGHRDPARARSRAPPRRPDGRHLFAAGVSRLDGLQHDGGMRQPDDGPRVETPRWRG